MHLLREINESVECSTTLEEGVAGNKKSYFIEGIYMQADKPNKNGRNYPKNILEGAVTKFMKLVESKRALGELGHPNTPQVNLHLASHLITNLRFEGSNVIGKAKILDTPNGRIAKNFIDEGIVLGVSSRALGSLKSVNGLNQVQEDLDLKTVDIVADPSAPDAFVNGIMENASWIFDNERGWVVMEELHETKNQMKKMSLREIEENKARIFENFLQKLSKTI